MAKKQNGVHSFGQTKFNSIRKRPSGGHYKNHNWQQGQRCESTQQRNERLEKEAQENE